MIIAIPFVGPLILFGFCVHLWRTSRGVLGSYCLCSRLPTKWKKKRNKKSIRDLEIEQDIAIAENKPNVALFAETETLPESTCCQRCNGCHPCEPSKFGWLRWITWILLATVATIVTIVIVALAIAFAVLRAQSLPNLSGSVTVKGLHQDVTVRWIVKTLDCAQSSLENEWRLFPNDSADKQGVKWDFSCSWEQFGRCSIRARFCSRTSMLHPAYITVYYTKACLST